MTRLPAEWEPQQGVLLSWPTRSTDWATNLIEAENSYLSLISAICRFETAHICVKEKETCTHVMQRLQENDIDMDKIVLHTLPYDDTWTRDYGPITVYRDSKPVWLNFRFNAWGSKYPHVQDDQLNRGLHENVSFNALELIDIDFVLEGGSIDCDGNGRLLTTTRCLLSQTRNPDMDKSAVENQLRESLGVNRILWLEHGQLEGDDTDAHIDTLARFCSADTIAYTQCTDPNDSHAESLNQMQQELYDMRQLNGEPYRLIPLPLPTPCYNDQGQRLPANYVNFLIINGAVLLPVYDVETDDISRQQVGMAFPNHEIIDVPSRALLEQYGSLHCVTMHLPA